MPRFLRCGRIDGVALHRRGRQCTSLRNDIAGKEVRDKKKADITHDCPCSSPAPPVPIQLPMQPWRPPTPCLSLNTRAPTQRTPPMPPTPPAPAHHQPGRQRSCSYDKEV
ncbi:hypothetical protein E2C01_036224 [Portunus trituberculatus]|uniref:Uncharacterized protein n=1 Tax=Portunus trituberculatus TaxID=210409 RepID=A0A5B7F687_PORTR|nr:hypothetical protein [Portunus trituberculatus]